MMGRRIGISRDSAQIVGHRVGLGKNSFLSIFFEGKKDPGSDLGEFLGDSHLHGREDNSKRFVRAAVSFQRNVVC